MLVIDAEEYNVVLGRVGVDESVDRVLVVVEIKYAYPRKYRKNGLII